MAIDLERFHHTRSAYERPNAPFSCGRAALWGKPCQRGPGPDGSCGGIAECTPVKSAKGRWECRRPAAAGGPCSEGPLPDGTCCNRQPACKPRPTLRRLRGRIALFAAVLPLILIAATFTLGGDSDATFNPFTHGPLSGGHARFTADKGCNACHVAHGAEAGDWIAAAFKPADMTGQCIECHTFSGEGRERAPHNFPANLVTDVTAYGGPAETSCTMCHQEHRGTNANLVAVSDAQCQTCHKDKFHAFGVDHPQFGPRYPQLQRTAIDFDHVAHFAKHFDAAQQQLPEDQRKQIGCVTCHEIDRATNVVPVGGFERTCASCHRDQIAKRDLAVFVLPALSPSQFVAIDHKAMADACGAQDPDAASALADSLKTAQAAVKANDPQGDFVPVSDAKLPAAQRLLIGAEGDEVIDLEPKDPGVAALLDLLPKIAQDGTAPLAELIDQRFGKGRGDQLLAGLSPELMRRTACAWGSNVEYTGKPPLGGGWYVDGVTLKYKPGGHSDAVVKAWLDAVVAPDQAASDPADPERLADLRSDILDPKNGPGTCIGCHGVTDPSASGDAPVALAKSQQLRVEWRHSVTQSGRNVRYSHRPHISLLGPGTDCQNCHVPDNEAAYADSFKQVNAHSFASNFKAIRQEQCTSCHGAGQVRDDCATCHNYHRDPRFKIKLMQQARQE